MSVHPNTQVKEDVDLLENMLKETGCMELHHKVQECVAEHQDWRKCQDVLKEFRLCIENYTMKKNLGIGKGKLASQCAHAAVSCYQKLLSSSPKTLRLWELMGQPKIVLKAEEEGEEYLLHLRDKAKALGLVTAIVRDAGRTQIESGTITVLGIGPGKSPLIDQVTKHLKLL